MVSGMAMRSLGFKKHVDWSPAICGCTMMIHDVPLEIWIFIFLTVWVVISVLLDWFREFVCSEPAVFVSLLTNRTVGGQMGRLQGHKQCTSEIVKRYSIKEWFAQNMEIWFLTIGKTCINDPWKTISCFHDVFGLRPRGFRQFLWTLEVGFPQGL